MDRKMNGKLLKNITSLENDQMKNNWLYYVVSLPNLFYILLHLDVACLTYATHASRILTQTRKN